MVTAVAPIAWGTTYIVTENFLPPDRPLFAAAARALPAGLVLLAWRRQLPHGDWWWKAALLGLCNIGLFFCWLLWRTGSLWVAIFCHALYNSLVVIVLRYVPLPA